MRDRRTRERERIVKEILAPEAAAAPATPELYSPAGSVGSPPSSPPPPIAPDDPPSGWGHSGADPAPPPSSPRPPSEDRPRRRTFHPDNFDWGPPAKLTAFHFTFSDAAKKPPHGQWMVTCPWHRVSAVTACTRTISLGFGGKDVTKRMLMAWCLQAPVHNRRRHHKEVSPQDLGALPEEVLRARMVAMPPPPAIVLTDAELDAEEGIAEDAASSSAAPPPAAAGAGRGRGRGAAPKSASAGPGHGRGGRGKAKAKAKSRVDSDSSRSGSITSTVSSLTPSQSSAAGSDSGSD